MIYLHWILSISSEVSNSFLRSKDWSNIYDPRVRLQTRPTRQSPLKRTTTKQNIRNFKNRNFHYDYFLKINFLKFSSPLKVNQYFMRFKNRLFSLFCTFCGKICNLKTTYYNWHLLKAITFSQTILMSSPLAMDMESFKKLYTSVNLISAPNNNCNQLEKIEKGLKYNGNREFNTLVIFRKNRNTFSFL